MIATVDAAFVYEVAAMPKRESVILSEINGSVP
jgi:hypothetical protein